MNSFTGIFQRFSLDFQNIYRSTINWFWPPLNLKLIFYVKSSTHFSPISHFYTPWKHHKTIGFLTFSDGIEMWHWTNMVTTGAHKGELLILMKRNFKINLEHKLLLPIMGCHILKDLSWSWLRKEMFWRQQWSHKIFTKCPFLLV